ncbi:MAG: class I SAM-dependent methyltransferase [Planctomycetia bacterium]|nr:class I SAM-dependent methyltransferase [Planctomycetia bacterium]
MGVIGGQLGYRLLRRLSPGQGFVGDGEVLYETKSKLDVFFGDAILPDLVDKVALDFGCGEGREVVEIAQRGARQVIGLDIRQRMLNVASEWARRQGVSDKCIFCQQTRARADTIVSCDAFEHFDDAAAILRIMAGLLLPGGSVWITFGPPWLHPRGGHLFSVFPWSHLVFTERALMRWRSDFKEDGAAHFNEVEGGLNQMTVRRFERIVAASPFRFDWLKLIPIRKARRLHNRLTREFFTSSVTCRLVLKV